MANLLRGQEQISAKRPMPVNETYVSPQVATSSSATVQLYYYNAGVRTSDAGQAAGTVVDATFVHKNILNTLGTTIASKNDTSLAYTCLALTTEIEVSSKPGLWELIEALDDISLSTRVAQIGALLSNGEFIIDYRRGYLIGKKATTASTMTSVTYNYTLPTGGTGTSATQIQGNAASGATDVGNPVKTGGVYNTSAPTLTNGQRGDTQMDVNANTLTRETYVATFENNTDQVAMTLPRAVATNTGAVSLDVSSALEASSVTKASAGRLYALSGYIDATAPSATYYIQILNAASLPADGAVTHLVEPKQIVHATGSPSYFSYDYGLFGRYASTGIVVCISSTQFTKTISGAYLAMTAAYL